MQWEAFHGLGSPSDVLVGTSILGPSCVGIYYFLLEDSFHLSELNKIDLQEGDGITFLKVMLS